MLRSCAAAAPQARTRSAASARARVGSMVLEDRARDVARHRLEDRGWVESEWGLSENNRKAKFYSITARGRKQLEVETENWERISGLIRRVLRQEAEG